MLNKDGFEAGTVQRTKHWEQISEQFVKQEVNVLLSSFLDHSTSEAVFGFAISASMTAAGS